MQPRQRISNPYRHIKREGGKRSGLETQVGATLAVFDATAKGEKDIDYIPYQNLLKKKYHPDYELTNGILIECKGWFKTQDRTKHLCIKAQHPELDIRFVFSNPNAKITKGSNTTYAMWCDKYGFKWSAKDVPIGWAHEPCIHPKQDRELKISPSYGTHYLECHCTRCGKLLSSKC